MCQSRVREGGSKVELHAYRQGQAVGYELIPLVNFFVGLDFQFSFVQPFAGEASDPVPPLDEDKLTVDLSANRLTLTVGVEFDL